MTSEQEETKRQIDRAAEFIALGEHMLAPGRE